MEQTEKTYSVAVFASDQGPGDAERSSIMLEVGSFLAKQGVCIVCVTHNGSLGVPLITSARSVGGETKIIADQDFETPSALSGVAIERFAGKPEKYQRISEVVDAYIGLPGSLASATSLFETWSGAGRGKPVGLLNRNRAFEVMRGFVTDVVGSDVKRVERRVLFADSVEDLWSRLLRSLTAEA